MTRLAAPFRCRSAIAGALFLCVWPSSYASAQSDNGKVAEASDKPDMFILVGGGIESRPKFPGAASNSFGFKPEIEIWREGEAFPVETPDEGKGFALIGTRGQTSFGPVFGFPQRRKGSDVAAGFSDVGFGLEVGGFVESYVTPAIRLRAELKQAIGAHNSLTGDIAADFVLRGKDENIVATIGPRVRWGSAKYTRTFFGVSAAESLASGLQAYQPSGGIYAFGVVGGAHVRLDKNWGLYAYAGYDRLTGDAASSPIVTNLGDRNQATAGLLLTRRFRIKR